MRGRWQHPSFDSGQPTRRQPEWDPGRDPQRLKANLAGLHRQYDRYCFLDNHHGRDHQYDRKPFCQY
jgi:hypothetical protein